MSCRIRVVSWRVKIPCTVAYGSEQNRRCWWYHVISILLCKWRLSACYHSVYSLWSWNLCHLVSPRPSRIFPLSIVKNWEEIKTMREEMEISLKWILLNFSYFIFVDFLPRNFISGDEMLLSISDWLRNLLIENRNVAIKKQIIFSSYKFLKDFVTFSHLSQTGTF